MSSSSSIIRSCGKSSSSNNSSLFLTLASNFLSSSFLSSLSLSVSIYFFKVLIFCVMNLVLFLFSFISSRLTRILSSIYLPSLLLNSRYAVYLSILGLFYFGSSFFWLGCSLAASAPSPAASSSVFCCCCFASSFLASSFSAFCLLSSSWFDLNFSGFSAIYLLMESICWLVWLYWTLIWLKISLIMFRESNCSISSISPFKNCWVTCLIFMRSSLL